MVERPLDPAVSLADMQAFNRLLVNCGASIDEMNSVRKHVSAVKGGRLAAAASAAMKISLGVTDVPDGRESALASGPTLPDPTTVADACSVVERYGLLPKLPAPIRARFEDPRSIPETPKAGDPAFGDRSFRFCWDVTTCFIRRITRRRKQDSLPFAITLPMTGPSRGLRIFCWRSSTN